MASTSPVVVSSTTTAPAGALLSGSVGFALGSLAGLDEGVDEELLHPALQIGFDRELDVVARCG